MQGWLGLQQDAINPCCDLFCSGSDFPGTERVMWTMENCAYKKHIAQSDYKSIEYAGSLNPTRDVCRPGDKKQTNKGFHTKYKLFSDMFTF